MDGLRRPPGHGPVTKVPWRNTPPTEHPSTMTTGQFQPMLQLGVLAAALLLAGLATLLQRRPERVLDWPPSPPPVRDVRRDLIVTSGALLFIVLGVGVAAIAICTVVLQVMASNAGPAGH